MSTQRIPVAEILVRSARPRFDTHDLRLDAGWPVSPRSKVCRSCGSAERGVPRTAYDMADATLNEWHKTAPNAAWYKWWAFEIQVTWADRTSFLAETLTYYNYPGWIFYGDHGVVQREVLFALSHVLVPSTVPIVRQADESDERFARRRAYGYASTEQYIEAIGITDDQRDKAADLWRHYDLGKTDEEMDRMLCGIRDTRRKLSP